MCIRDRKILEEIRKTEALSAVRKEILEVNNIATDYADEVKLDVNIDENSDLEKIDIFKEFEEEEV